MNYIFRSRIEIDRYFRDEWIQNIFIIEKRPWHTVNERIHSQSISVMIS